ncbi:uncharacterized protein LOC130960820 [Arachis stenosperma]|uniref:uncharacterized protein LOC130960820 n=1 Tax=Arachis stenosperma TaxID=217475 RepID=UPI0025AC8AB0|nr:uncharacterized protein LOC130960820 [Arachis stenosperma]
MGLSSRTIEITVISGENVHVKEESYVVVRAESLKSCTTKAAKNTDIIINNNHSSSLISWNEKLLLEIPMHARSITFEVQCKNSRASSARPVGVARIAISNILLGGSGFDSDSDGDNNVLSYRLRDWDGRRNGVIHFSVTTAKITAAVEEAVEPPVKGLVEDHMKKNNKNSNEVVLGVPLWWNYPNII